MKVLQERALQAFQPGPSILMTLALTAIFWIAAGQASAIPTTKLSKVKAASTVELAPALIADLTTQLAERTVENNIRKLILTNACMGCDLAEADLVAAYLIGADLRQANLQGANLSTSNLEGADLTGADLTGANLTSAYLTNAILSEADLDGVNFTNARLYYVNVAGASVQNINLTDAEILNTPLGIGGAIPLDGEDLPDLPSPQ